MPNRVLAWYKSFRTNHPSAAFWSAFLALELLVLVLWMLYPAFGRWLSSMGWFWLSGVEPFEGADSLFAALAFAAIIYTILLQREELQATREELSGQRLQLERQGDLLVSQQFNDSFFKLLEFHTSNVRAMAFAPDVAHQLGYRDTGRAVFERIRGDIEGPLADYQRQDTEFANNRRVRLMGIIRDIERRTGLDLTFYLNNLAALLGALDAAPASERARALRALQAQLSQGELHVINYYVTAPEGVLEVRDLIERYGLLFGLEHSPVSEQFTFLKSSAYKAWEGAA